MASVDEGIMNKATTNLDKGLLLGLDYPPGRGRHRLPLRRRSREFLVRRGIFVSHCELFALADPSSSRGGQPSSALLHATEHSAPGTGELGMDVALSQVAGIDHVLAALMRQQSSASDGARL